MISNKLKKDAAKIDAGIKILTTKLPLALHDYNYLNEDARVVVARRNDQLDEINVVKKFLSEQDKFSNILKECETEYKKIKDHLKSLQWTNKVDDFSSNTDDMPQDKGNPIEYNCRRKTIVISRENSLCPDTPYQRRLFK